jgi:DNA-directed RNA polymerase subunit RPC12/RpoP
MAKQPEVGPHVVNGKGLRCPHCEHERFWTRSTLMNTKGATFLGFEWANKEARNYVCDQCGHVLWFLEKP